MKKSQLKALRYLVSVSLLVTISMFLFITGVWIATTLTQPRLNEACPEGTYETGRDGDLPICEQPPECPYVDNIFQSDPKCVPPTVKEPETPQEAPQEEPKPATPQPTPKQPSGPVPADVSLQLINKSRNEAGLKGLVVSRSLTSSAAAKCQHMVVNHYWSHDGGGRTWHSFINGFTYVGEILAKSFSDQYAQHQSWLNSPSHRATLLGDFEYFGVARCVYEEAWLGNLTVVHFGK